MIKNIKRIKKRGRTFTSVVYRGNEDEVTYKAVYDFCVKEIEKIENDKDYKLLCELYSKIKTKYENKKSKLDFLKSIKRELDFIGKSNSNDIWGD